MIAEDEMNLLSILQPCKAIVMVQTTDFCPDGLKMVEHSRDQSSEHVARRSARHSNGARVVVLTNGQQIFENKSWQVRGVSSGVSVMRSWNRIGLVQRLRRGPGSGVCKVLSIIRSPDEAGLVEQRSCWVNLSLEKGWSAKVSSEISCRGAVFLHLVAALPESPTLRLVDFVTNMVYTFHVAHLGRYVSRTFWKVL